MKKWMIALVIIAGASIAQAQNLSIGNASYAGSGCPAGRGPRLFMRSGNLMLKYNFTVSDQDIRKNCAIAVPIRTQPGFRVVLESTQVLTNFTGRTLATVSTQTFFLGQYAEEQKSASFNLQAGNRWSNPAGLGSESACTGLSELRINTDLKVLSRGLAKLDTQALKLVVQRCN